VRVGCRRRHQLQGLDTAPVTINGALVSAFENNLIAVLAEAEYGFVCHDTAAFVQYTNAS
jgi:hypothetical protein